MQSLRKPVAKSARYESSPSRPVIIHISSAASTTLPAARCEPAPARATAADDDDDATEVADWRHMGHMSPAPASMAAPALRQSCRQSKQKLCPQGSATCTSSSMQIWHSTSSAASLPASKARLQTGGGEQGVKGESRAGGVRGE